ncbi:5-aminolevulinate synthase [Pseudooceanicola nanhaiensis]|uniref:5-aminolevulinate synthase n=1 Tax=Pseudooceanicola nanhaiensis TaxID=375761 RepID=UPI001CD34E07|nr:5-aminolevulinate synthase [Pseudooceanicola nanhaiensis]MCA0920973.1 5-aminolevulinate synthase [Pseudooceanicola nanhaiensis]
MLTTLSQAQILTLIFLTALGYALATAGIKLTSDGAPGLFPLLAITTGFLIATVSEVLLLRGTELSTAYLLIVAAETILVLAFALSLGDSLSPRQVLGGLAVIIGMVLVAH